jgi:hypothetical protein
MNLRNPRDGEMQYELNNYFPEAHYKLAIDEALEREIREDLIDEDDDFDEMLPDGGRPRKYFFAWRDENGEYLSDKTVNGDAADVAYSSVEEAEQSLERLIDTNPEQQDRYKSASLYKIKQVEKVMEGVEVMTEQQGLTDF